MNLKQIACVAFSLSFGAALLAEQATSTAYGANFFGFNFSTALSNSYAYSVPKSAYPPIRIVHRHAQKKTHHHYARRVPLNLAAKDTTMRDEWPLLTKRIAAMQKANPGALAMFLNDTTLKKHDAVMTNAGIFVFTGEASQYHSPQEFTSLTRSKRLLHYAELNAIEKVSVTHFEVAQAERSSQAVTFADVRPAVNSFEAVDTKAIRRIAGVFD